jgi:hypothetical protein
MPLAEQGCLLQAETQRAPMRRAKRNEYFMTSPFLKDVKTQQDRGYFHQEQMTS